MSFKLEQLTEGIRQRHVGAQNKRLVEKWNRTGLLRGLDDVKQENMSTLLENQAAQVLREANTLGGSAGSSDIRGFANIAFPIVRRVFGGLVANDLVSIQPMSLPSGLLFYLDYTYGSSQGSYTPGQSLYNSPAGKGVQSGSLGVGGQYDLAGTGYSKNHIDMDAALDVIHRSAGGADLVGAPNSSGVFGVDGANGVKILTSEPEHMKLIQYDPQIIDRIDNYGEEYSFVGIDITALNTDLAANADAHDQGTCDTSFAKEIALTTCAGTGALDVSIQGTTTALNVKRLNQIGFFDNATSKFVPNAFATGATSVCLMVVRNAVAGTDVAHNAAVVVSCVKADTFSADPAGGDVLTVPSFESNFGADPNPVIPEIDIKIESIPVTAQTRKLRARWSPELAQDLNAYHSMDAEVELTQILSEQIALEIDREILNDLLVQARGENYYWSRSPGKFVNKKSGAEIARTSTLTPGPAFTGTVREWYETLTETVIDVANEIHRKTLRGSANFIVVSPDVATILESSVMYRPDMSIDGQGQVGSAFSMGAEKVGKLSNRFTVYKDPYFPRNKILVGYKGGSYLETGYVYAPYVPLIVTPTIFAPEDFTPRKGVMTRYGKKMVRADFYGTVTCLDMNVI